MLSVKTMTEWNKNAQAVLNNLNEDSTDRDVDHVDPSPKLQVVLKFRYSYQVSTVVWGWLVHK